MGWGEGRRASLGRTRVATVITMYSMDRRVHDGVLDGIDQVGAYTSFNEPDENASPRGRPSKVGAD